MRDDDEVPISVSLLASLRDAASAEEAQIAVDALVALIPDEPPKTDDDYRARLYRALWPSALASEATKPVHAKGGLEIVETLWAAGFEPPRLKTEHGGRKTP